MLLLNCKMQCSFLPFFRRVGLQVPKNREKPIHPDYGNSKGTNAADDGCRHGTDQPGHRAGFEFAELIGSADEERVNGIDPALHLLGRVHLYKRRTDHDADDVGCAGEKQREERKPDAAGDAKQDGRQGEHHERGKQRFANGFLNRNSRENQRNNDRADCWRGAKQAEASRTGLQDFVGKDGQQCRRTAEQNGEQIERDGAQDDFTGEYEPQTAEKGVNPDGIQLFNEMNGLHEENQYDGYKECDQRCNVGRRDAPDHEYASERRADDHRRLHPRGGPGGCLRQLLAVDDIRHEGGRSRTLEGTASAKNGRGDQQMDRGDPALNAADDEKDDDSALHELANIHDGTAIIAVRRLPGRQRQQQHRQELGQADKAELKGAVRQCVHLPTNDDGQNLKRAGRENPRNP